MKKTKTATISVRIDATLKKQAEQILNKIGMTTSRAITTFYKQIVLWKAIPFRIGVPPAKPKFLEEYTKEELDAELLRSYRNSKKKNAKFYTAEELKKKLYHEFGFDSDK